MRRIWLLLVSLPIYSDSFCSHSLSVSVLSTIHRITLRQWQLQTPCNAVGNTHDEKNHVECKITNDEPSTARRSFLAGTVPSIALGLSSPSLLLLLLDLPHNDGPAAAAAKGNDDDSGRLPDSVIGSLVFERVLGAGSYKTVYLVSATIPASSNDAGAGASTRTVRYAMAVERLRYKRDVTNAFRGVRIPDSIRRGLERDGDDGDEELFETIVDWWVQPSDVPGFAAGRRPFPAASGDGGRTRSEPGRNFAGSRWMLSFKPVYETDLGRFVRDAPTLFPVGGGGDRPPGDGAGASPRDDWTETAVLKFVLDMLHAGKLMHKQGIVHRDIKPKNVMIALSPSSPDGQRRRPVIIDYGFSEVGSLTPLEAGGGARKATGKEGDVCVVRPGNLKGEVEYVLAEDLANYRGCRRGDAYAMGKTVYEFVFGSAELRRRGRDEGGRDDISVDAAKLKNGEFRELLFDDPAAGSRSRFRLSRAAADRLLSIVRGLCGSGRQHEKALSFAEAEQILSDFISQYSPD